MKKQNKNHLPKSVILEFLRRHSIKVKRTTVKGVRVWEGRNPFGEVFHARGLQELYWAYSRVAAGLPDDRTPAPSSEAQKIKVDYQKISKAVDDLSEGANISQEQAGEILEKALGVDLSSWEGDKTVSIETLLEADPKLKKKPIRAAEIQRDSEGKITKIVPLT